MQPRFHIVAHLYICYVKDKKGLSKFATHVKLDVLQRYIRIVAVPTLLAAHQVKLSYSNPAIPA